jgi:hypothetical protein
MVTSDEAIVAVVGEADGLVREWLVPFPANLSLQEGGLRL